MKNNKFYLIAALAGTLLAGCQTELAYQNPEEVPVAEQTWTLTVQATKSVESRALGLNNNNAVETSWKQGEKVGVFFGETRLGYLEVISEDNANPAILQGSLTKDEDIAQGSSLKLIFPDRENETLGPWSYLGQDGTAPDATGSLATKFDYATTTITVANVGETEITLNSNSVHFSNEQSMFKFTFKEGANNLAAKYFILTSSQNQLAREFSCSGSTWSPTYGSLTMTPTANGSPYWMSIRNDNTSVADDFTFTVVASNDALYEGKKTIPVSAGSTQVLGTGKTVGASIVMTQKAFEPEESGDVSSMENVL